MKGPYEYDSFYNETRGPNMFTRGDFAQVMNLAYAEGYAKAQKDSKEEKIARAMGKYEGPKNKAARAAAKFAGWKGEER